MKHLRLFKTEAEYNSATLELPNVSYVEETKIVNYIPESSSSSDYVMVDLGLPSGLLWADRNVGASSPEDAGLYFQWGDAVGYTTEDTTPNGKYFGWTDYFDTTDKGSTFNKYNNNGGFTVLQPEDDAATVNMGSDWRMPTRDEFKELISNTMARYIDFDGNEYKYSDIKNNDILDGILKGVKLISKINSNSIFIPAGGEIRGYNETDISGIVGELWTSSLSSSPVIDPDTKSGYAYFLSYQAPNTSSMERCYGKNVRGVKQIK